MSDELFHELENTITEKELTNIPLENPLIIKIKDTVSQPTINLFSESSDIGTESDYESPKIINLTEKAETEVILNKLKTKTYENEDEIKRLNDELIQNKEQLKNKQDNLKKLTDMQEMSDIEDEKEKIKGDINIEREQITKTNEKIADMEKQLTELMIEKDTLKKESEDLLSIYKILELGKSETEQPKLEDGGPPTEIAETEAITQPTEAVPPIERVLTPVPVQEKSLIVDDLLLQAIKSKMDSKKYKDPFKRFYEPMETKEMSNYIVSVTDANEASNFKYDFSAKEYDEEKKYSTSDIPVFFRKQKEALTYLFENDYYKELNFNNIVLNGDNIKKFNPHVFDSFHYNDYIVSSTLTPLFPKDLIMFAINFKTKKYYTCMDFYFDPTFIIDMFTISHFLNSDEAKYVVFNSMETGSLFETYHFHIIESKVPYFGAYFKNNAESMKASDVYKKIEPDADSPFTVGYLINLSHVKFYNFLYNLPALLYELRLENSDKYFAQVFFFKENDKDLLFINFRKVPLEHIRLDEKKALPPQYWDSLYESVNKLYNIVYLPIGLVNYKSKDIKNAEKTIEGLLTKPEVIAEMKKPYYDHPKFESKIIDFLRKSSSTVINSKVKKSFGTGLDYCINLKNDIINSGINNMDCYKLPILYNLGKRNILGNDNTENGLMLIDGTYFHFIVTNPALETKLDQAQQINEDNDLKDVVLTNYTSIKNLTAKYYLYNPVRTYLLDFIRYIAKDRLIKNSSIINSFIVMIVYKLIKLQKKGVRLTNLDINKFYLVENNIKVIDYTFNDSLIISIAKEENDDCHYKLYHEGLEVFLPFEIKKERYDIKTMLGDLKNIINQLHHYCKENGINNLLLNDINSTFDRTDYNLDTIIYKFTFGIDYFTCKAPNWDAFKRINQYIFDGKASWDDMVKRLKSTPDLDPVKYPKIEIKTDDFFMSGIVQDPSGIKEGDILKSYHLNELQYNISNQPTYFFRIKNNTIDMKDQFYSKYFELVFSLYSKWKSSSRVYYYKANKPLKLIDLNFGDPTSSLFRKNKMVAYIDILKNIFGLNITQTTQLKYAVTDKYHIQEMINFALTIKYPDLAGYKMNGIYDEYIFLKKADFLSCYAVAKLTENNFELFYDYDTFTDAAKTTRYKIFDSEGYDNYYVWLSQEVIKDYDEKHSDTQLDGNSILRNINYDFYSLPRQDPRVISFDELELKYGESEYYKIKYEKYKAKYQRLKRRIGLIE